IPDALGELSHERLDLGRQKRLGHVLQYALQVVLDELEHEEYRLDLARPAVGGAVVDHHLVQVDDIAVRAVLQDLDLAQARLG
ncbi:hypothetical protein KJ359_011072, partial [Pestalotiopsis sp. 9143b]